MNDVQAVLLDLGGVFYLPDHDRMVAALARLQIDMERDRLDEVHYRGVAALRHEPSDNHWHAYNRAYARASAASTRTGSTTRSTCSSRSSGAAASGPA